MVVLRRALKHERERERKGTDCTGVLLTVVRSFGKSSGQRLNSGEAGQRRRTTARVMRGAAGARDGSSACGLDIYGGGELGTHGKR